ncbi:MAG: four helix bundle protein [Marinilabiliaceae bacterium]|nr:four helix bundle protein [Marinilabiliaceae bacterium]
MAKRFEDLEIWQKSRDLCKLIYKTTDSDLFNEDVNLRHLLRNTSGLVMDNITEGFERNSNKEFINFLNISIGSCGKIKSQLYRALDNEYITDEDMNTAFSKISQLSNTITDFIQFLKKSELLNL